MSFRKLRLCASFFLLLMLNEVLFPVYAWALTGGPDQPEMHGFKSVGSSDMVDLFTGDFSYNVPLLDVGGYPLNINYSSGATMEQEASWVGLGWSLNPGVITKEMRGIPDEFNGKDIIKKEYNIRDNWTVGGGLGGNVDFAGAPIGFGANGGVFYNSYKGPGIEGGITVSANMGSKGGGSLTAGLGFNSQT
ncbi:MAG TPA: hypothetical protein VK364_10030, partial [Hymenobacter sp.]|nr:hypothetical protein [Hymenobacter sp.]